MKTLKDCIQENGGEIRTRYDEVWVDDGSIIFDNEAQLLATFNAWQAQQMGGDISEWLKDGETVIQRLERERSDLCSTLKMLAGERQKIETLKNIKPSAEVTKHGIFGIDRSTVFNVGDKLYLSPPTIDPAIAEYIERLEQTLRKLDTMKIVEQIDDIEQVLASKPTGLE